MWHAAAAARAAATGPRTIARAFGERRHPPAGAGSSPVHADTSSKRAFRGSAPWEAAIGLVQGAARVLPPGGLLFLYGPFKREGRHTAPSNEAFDRDFLKARNPAWGVRDLEAVAALAAGQGFAAPEIVQMPANNLSVLFRRLT